MLPDTAFRILMATCREVRFEFLEDGPPPKASPGEFSIKFLASSFIFFAGTPVASATFSGAKAANIPERKSYPPFLSRMTDAILNATIASLPGLITTQRSAFAPVSET